LSNFFSLFQVSFSPKKSSKEIITLGGENKYRLFTDLANLAHERLSLSIKNELKLSINSI
jgi:hypothetical protein